MNSAARLFFFPLPLFRPFYAALLTLACTVAQAQLSAIHRDQLPQTTAVSAAVLDAAQLEPYTDRWSPEWKFPVTKQQAAARLGLDLSVLRTAAKEDPNNEELLLLTALVAHYAYNVDVDGSDGATLENIANAEKLRPGDLRPAWFRADFLCQTDKPVQGADGFLAVEAAHPWKDLPASFWVDYEHCAAVTNMPAHLLRAADYLAHLSPDASEDQKFYVQLGRSRFSPVDMKKTYDAKDAWYGNNAGADTDITSTACGVRLRAHGTWPVDRVDLEKGTCAAVFSTGPYPAPRGPLAPEIVIIVRQPLPGETLTDFLSRFTTKGTFQPASGLPCPAAKCIEVTGAEPRDYGTDGDSHPHVIAFERDEPDFPGLLFEAPMGPPTKESEQVQYFRPTQVLHRMPGKLYYLIALDTASSIEPQAVADFQFFLQNIKVE